MKAWRWIIVLVLLLALVVTGDRVGASVAQGQIATQFPCHTSAAAEVSINGVPFLTQALSGVYDDIEVKCSRFGFKAIADAVLDVRLSGAHVPVTDALNNPKQVPVDVLNAELFVPYASLASSSGISGLTLHLQDGHVGASAPINAPFLGTVAVTAVGDFTDPGDGVTLSLRDFKANGAQAPQVLDSFLGGLTKIRLLQDAPYGMQIVSVTPTATGVIFKGRATDVVLRKSTTN